MGKGDITFRPGKDGMIEAVRDGKVVGHVYTNDNIAAVKKPGSGSAAGKGKTLKRPDKKK